MKDAYKIFKELEERNKRANPYKFYDKDELIDEILKDEDEIERLNNIIDKAIEYIEEKEEILLNCDEEWLDHDEMIDRKRFKKILEILKGSDK